jgi:hypothetical protein
MAWIEGFSASLFYLGWP